MQPPALVIFDCDGVLVDSEHLCHGVIHAMLAEEGVEISYEETITRFIGTSNPGLLAGVAELCGVVPVDFLERFRARTNAAFSESLAAVPGVDAVVAAMRVPFCVASNGRLAKMRLTLGKTGLLRHFEGRMFSAEEVARPKPAPDLHLHAADSLGVRPGDCIVIEDTTTGVMAAKAAGMRAFAFAAMTPVHRLQEAGADAVFEDMGALRRLLAGCGALGQDAAMDRSGPEG
jgi:HAD superfamily hydrolase (TIGR01509 family)